MFGIQVVTVQVEKREPCGQKNLRGAKKHFKNNKSISLHKTRKRPVCKCLQDCGGFMQSEQERTVILKTQIPGLVQRTHCFEQKTGNRAS